MLLSSYSITVARLEQTTVSLMVTLQARRVFPGRPWIELRGAVTQFPPGSRPIDRAGWGATCPGRGSPGAAGAGLEGSGGPGDAGLGVPGAVWGCGEPSPARPSRM